MVAELAPPSSADAAPPHASLPFLHRYYIILKAHYFLFYAAFGIIYPILNITLRSRGLSNTELSYFNIGIPFLVFVTNPLVSFVADSCRRYRLTFNVVLALATIVCIAIFAMPPVKSHNIQADLIYDRQAGQVLDFCASQEVATKCASRTQCGCAYQADCTFDDARERMKMFFTFAMDASHVSKEVRNTIGNDRQRACGVEYRVPVERAIQQYERDRNLTSDRLYQNQMALGRHRSRIAACDITCSIAHYCHGPRHDNQNRLIVLYSILFVLGANTLFNAMPLGVSVGFATLHRPDIFGKQRVWGTVGFGILAYAASWIYASFESEFVYIVMFTIASILCMVITCFVRIQPHERKQRPDATDGEQSGRTAQSRPAAIISLLKRLDVIVFLSLAFIWGMSYAALDPFLYLYIDELAPCQSRGIIGTMALISSIAEVIALFFAERVLKRLGMNLASIVIFLAFAIRFSGYYYIQEPYLLAIMEVMHFFNFGILYVLIIQKANSIAPPGLSGTVQSLSLGIMFGLARGIGLIASSFIYTLLEQRLLFLIFAVFNVICAVVFGLYFLVEKKRRKAVPAQDPSKLAVEVNLEPLLAPPTSATADSS